MTMTDTNPLLAAFTAAAAMSAPPVGTQAPVTAPPETTQTVSADPVVPAAAAPADDYRGPFDFLDDPKKADEPAKPEEKVTADATAADTPDASGEFPEDIPDATPAAKAKWGELRKALKEAQTKAAEFEAKAKEPIKDPMATALEAKVKEYEAKVKEYEGELAITRVEATPEYKAVVTEPLNAIIKAAEAVAGAYKADASSLIEALTEVDPAKQTKMLEEVVDGMHERDRARVYRMADDAAAVYAKDMELRERADTALAEVEARRKAESEQSEAQRKLTHRSATQKVWEAVAAKVPDLGVDMAKLGADVVNQDFFSATPETLGYAASASVILPHAVKAITARDARIKELEAAVAGLRKASPSAANTSSSAGTPPSSLNPVAQLLFSSP